MGLSKVAPCPPKMPTISASIIAYNSAEKIEAAILSVLWADEIVVADSASTDGTAEIATQLGARVVQIPFNGFGDLRNRAVEACCGKGSNLASDRIAALHVIGIVHFSFFGVRHG